MRTFLLFVVCCLLTWPADGQTIWSRPYEPGQIAVEAMMPDLSDTEASAPSGATYLTTTISLSDHVEFAGELPVARYVPSSESAASSETALGNPYLGLGFSSTTLPLMMEVGARVPVASSSPALNIGSATDMGRTRAFAREELSLSALANTRATLGRRSSLRLRTGFTYASFSPIDTTGTERSEQDWRLLYSAQLWREGDTAILGLSFTGRAVLTAPGSFRAKSRHHLVGSLMGNWNTVQPGLLVGLSMNNLREDLAPLFGLTLSISYAR